MFIPDNKKIEVVGFQRYLRAVRFWFEGVEHLAGFYVNEAKLHMPFFNKESCIMRQWYHLVISSQAIYAVSLLILDEDSVKEFNEFRKETLEIWQKAYGIEA